LTATCRVTGARAGILETPHGTLPTPAFMPVGTQATVKSLTPDNLARHGARCVLSNTYHLALRPGAEAVDRQGGLHRFMGWSGPMLTDSGGFQVMSLRKRAEVNERGVRFHSHVDGSQLDFTPEAVVRTQEQLGADLVMPLDDCRTADASRADVTQALDRSRRWALRSRAAHRRADQWLFGIVQGGMFQDLRVQAARDYAVLGFPGYAIGGLSVGEPRSVTDDLVIATVRELPPDRPRSLMGVGTPEQIVDYTVAGVDMFDCVLPTRLARTGVALLDAGRLDLRRAELSRDPSPIQELCDCATCARVSRAYLHVLTRAGEPLAARLLSVHNLRVLIRTAEAIREAIVAGRLPEWLEARKLADAPAQAPVASRRGVTARLRSTRAPVQGLRWQS
ncbi:MAG: tRNA guanosine(34) transglycosylase Tgt, partial [Chloroflexi bacterium]|nr:tRNA guanosine(34) transglycosylase Tgt [Chloroflexota bacterium]